MKTNHSTPQALPSASDSAFPECPGQPTRPPLRHRSAPAGLQNLENFGPGIPPDCDAQSWRDAMWLVNQGVNQGIALASISGMGSLIHHLIEGGHDVNASNQQGLTAMHVAAGMGKAELILTLVTYGAHLETKCHNGHTPLLTAIKRGHSEAAIQLLTLGADPNARDNQGKPAIKAALDRGLFKIVTAMERLGVSGSDRTDEDNRELMRAIEMGQSAQVLALTRFGGHVPIDKVTGQTALHFAATFNNLDVTRALLINGLSLNTVDAKGNTPLHEAARVGNEPMMQFLSQAGGFGGLRNREGLTPAELLARVRHRNSRTRPQSTFQPIGSPLEPTAGHAGIRVIAGTSDAHRPESVPANTVIKSQRNSKPRDPRTRG